MAKRKASRSSRPLVVGYLERVSSKVLSDHARFVTDLIGRSHGVYALYKGEKLYYVGLASNLRGRLRTHLRDRHAGKWTKFSLYLVRKADHIHELESILLRIADPTGNATKGRLGRAKNLRPALKAGVKDHFKDLVDKYFGPSPRSKLRHTKKKSRSKQLSDTQAALKPYIRRRCTLRAEYKGYVYSAKVRGGGMIEYNGKRYLTPTAAARAVTRRTVNGWSFWKYQKRQGVWVKLSELRGKKA